MLTPRDVLTPASFSMLQVIARTGSFAAAARALNMVPSALTYRVRQIEEALDVLLFDRSSRKARPTEAAEELLREGSCFLADIDAIANRVKRVATGWEPEFTIAVDCIIDRPTIMELCELFFQLNPPTRLRLRTETLTGTLEAVTSGEADLALGVVVETSATTGVQREVLGTLQHVFAMSPRHPLTHAAEPLSDADLRKHRAVSIADSARLAEGIAMGLQAGQDVLTVTDMSMMLSAQVKGVGAGFLPTSIAQPYIDLGQLVTRQVARPIPGIQVTYVWRSSERGRQGRALQWWLNRLEHPLTRAALLAQTAPGGEGIDVARAVP